MYNLYSTNKTEKWNLKISLWKDPDFWFKRAKLTGGVDTFRARAS